MLKRAVLVVTVFFGCLGASALGQTKLEWKFKVGDKFFVETTTAKKGSLTFEKKVIPVESTTTLLAGFTVLKKTADGYEIEEEIELMRDRAASGATDLPKVLFKSLLEPEIVKGAKTRKGATFQIALRPNGQLSFSGYNTVVERLGRKNETVAKLVKELMPEASWKGLVEDLFSILPKKQDVPVQTGTSWERPSKVGLGRLGSFTVQYHYVFKKETRAGAEIEVNAKLKFTPPEKTATGLPFKIVDGAIASDSAKGTLTFDAGNGRLVRSTLAIHFKGTLTIEAGGKKGILLKVDQRQTVVSRVLEHNPLLP